MNGVVDVILAVWSNSQIFNLFFAEASIYASIFRCNALSVHIFTSTLFYQERKDTGRRSVGKKILHILLGQLMKKAVSLIMFFKKTKRGCLWGNRDSCSFKCYTVSGRK